MRPHSRIGPTDAIRRSRIGRNQGCAIIERYLRHRTITVGSIGGDCDSRTLYHASPSCWCSQGDGRCSIACRTAGIQLQFRHSNIGSRPRGFPEQLHHSTTTILIVFHRNRNTLTGCHIKRSRSIQRRGMTYPIINHQLIIHIHPYPIIGIGLQLIRPSHRCFKEAGPTC